LQVIGGLTAGMDDEASAQPGEDRPDEEKKDAGEACGGHGNFSQPQTRGSHQGGYYGAGVSRS
jgi:hypothetical protein